MNVLKINELDSVYVALKDLKKGDVVEGITLLDDIKTAHKFALKDIKAGENIIKYGYPIGHATCDIKKGSHVHTHNVKTNLSDELTYTYNPIEVLLKDNKNIKVNLFRRKNGTYGIRNHLFIVPLVGCVNSSAELIKQRLEKECDLSHIDSVIVLKHPFGCSQMGGDKKFTEAILKKSVLHPNAGGVLVLSLGCEENRLEPFMESLGDYDKDRIVSLKSQDVEDEVETGFEICKQLVEKMKDDKRIESDLSNIRVGLKCGGSDGFSGITANPLVGLLSDYVVSVGGTSVLSEVPEMFGAEQVLMTRAKNKEVFNKIVKLINDFKKYYEDHNQVCYENPSPGNKEGGITTLEDKSLGCVQKAGHGIVEDVVFDDGVVLNKGLNLLNGPGNDMIACTNLAAAGCQLILFTTGRGTPFGTYVPTVKIATNTSLSVRKKNWIDFNAGAVVDGTSMEEVFADFLNKIINIINGEKVCNEINKFEEISIFKDGVTL